MLRSGTLAKSILSFGPERFGNSHNDSGRGTTGIIYSSFLRVLRRYHSAVPGRPPIPKVMAELGLGSSFGFFLAALIAGSQRYYALDLAKQFSGQKNLRVFDELVALFRDRAPIPNDGWCARISPFTHDLDFPHEVLSREVGTVMWHSIHYSSHSLTSGWSRHWCIGKTLWSLARGKHHYFINRLPNAEHLTYLPKYGFAMVDRLRRMTASLGKNL